MLYEISPANVTLYTWSGLWQKMFQSMRGSLNIQTLGDLVMIYVFDFRHRFFFLDKFRLRPRILSLPTYYVLIAPDGACRFSGLGAETMPRVRII